MTVIRPSVMEDAAALAEIERECFSEPWSMGAIQSTLATDSACFFTAIEEDTGMIVGYVGMLIAADIGEIINVAVTSACRRRGIGRRLLDALDGVADEKHLSELQLEVRASNAPAIALYTALGYEIAGRRKNFYRKPTEDALLMNKSLSHT